MLASRAAAWECIRRRAAVLHPPLWPESIGRDRASALSLHAAVIAQACESPALSLQLGPHSRPTFSDLSMALRRLCDELARNVGDSQSTSFVSRLVLIDRHEPDWSQISTSTQRTLVDQMLEGMRYERPETLAESMIDSWRVELTERFLLPREVTQTMLRLADTGTSQRVQCLGIASQTVAIECMRARRTPVIVSTEVPFVAIFYALITGAAIEFEQRNPLSPHLQNGRESRFVGPTISVPAFGQKVAALREHDFLRSEFDLQMSESLALEHAERYTHGIAVVFTANRVLSSRGRENELRHSLVERGRLRAVITFPPGLLQTTSLPFSLVVLDTRDQQSRTVFCRIDEAKHLLVPSGRLRKRDRRLIGSAQVLDTINNTALPWCRSVATEEIEKHDYVLSVDRYLRSPDEVRLAQIAGTRAILKLEDVTLIVSCQTLRSLDTADGVEIHEVGPSEFPSHGYLERATRATRRVNPIDSRRGRQQILRDGDVLLATKGAIGRVAVARPASDSEVIFASPATLLLRLRPDSPMGDPVVLFMYLRSPLFQSLLRAVEARTATPHVSVADVRSLPVVVPTLEERRHLRLIFDSQAQLGREIDALVREQDRIARDAWVVSGLGEMEVGP